ncbi:hypothetical protein V8G54_016536 [Vigna mungo]|uniref:Uncharacterized protein n=1 Tax=Vigna mungo TaxID=3915 RepID=A0AAQ3NNA1_VIGMU
MREAANHVLVLQYYEMDFDADVCEPEIDFPVFDHMHDVPVEIADFTPCFDHSHIINSLFIDRVHIPASSVFYDCTDVNALLDDESKAYDDRYAIFDDMKVDLADLENACRGGCEICEEINAAICSASNSFADVKEEFIMCKLDGNDPDEAASDQRTHVYSEPSIPIEVSEVQIGFNVFDLLKIESTEPIIDTAVDIPVHSHYLDSAFSIDHFDIPLASNLCTDIENIFYDNLDGVATEAVELGKVVLDEPTQVESELELATGLFEIPTTFNILHALPGVPDISYNFDMLDKIFVVHHIETLNGCSELKAVFSDDMINDLLSDDDITAHTFMDTHANFELDVDAAEFSEKEATGTEANLVEAGDGLNETRGPWNVQYQHQLHEEPWLLQKGVWKAHKKLPTFDGGLMMIRQRANGEKPISQFLTFLFSCTFRFLLVMYVLLTSIVNSRIENMLFFIKLKRINFDLWPI